QFGYSPPRELALPANVDTLFVMPQVPQDYVPVFLQIVLGLGFAVFTLAASVVIGKRGRRTHAKDQPTPAGFDPAKYEAIGESDRMTLRFHKA
ncbi:MAG TPA: hypothetical protein VKQ54_06135, partial [Caulobacteraceae bacterium]|nr:hypothetical protein [Caulobacteraceae bacterium]